MPIQILELGKQFRPATSVVYPPFKNGRYMEEYFYDYVVKNRDTINSELVYIPAFWTNIQLHPNFKDKKDGFNILLKRAYSLLPENTTFFTIVQADLGVELVLPKNTIVFGACFGDIPLPLIYEDKTNRLETAKENNLNKERPILASFVGTHTTHPLRMELFSFLSSTDDIKFVSKPNWTNNITESLADSFINTTLDSKFCLAPRGFGRSSFRFFEAILLDTIPVYFWDDIEWLPYKDEIDYTKFAITIHAKDISKTRDILKSISNEKYLSLLEELTRVKHYFTLEGMSEYIIRRISNPLI